MKPPQKYLILDFETRSRAELKKVGGYEYARHPSTRVMCVGWRMGTKEELRRQLNEKTPAKVWSPAFPSPYGELRRALLDPSVIIVAHNAFFEQVIIRFVLSNLIHDEYLKNIPIDRFMCTASFARALALPARLELACAALHLPVQKDMEGHRLMLKLSKPRKPTKKDKRPWHNNARDLLRVMQYCATDVDAETYLFLTIPGLSPAEREIWKLDQKINWRGINVDRPTVKRILGWIETENARHAHELRDATGGAVQTFNQRDRTLRFLEGEGVFLPNLTKQTVADALESGLAGSQTTPSAALRVLRVRQAAAKSSVAKYEAFERRSRTDSRVRDNLVYHTASTGRWGGAGVQPQNFPRGTVADTDLAAEILADPSTDLALIESLYGNPMDLFSSCCRPMIKAAPGKELFGGDFAGIEVRVLFWVAKHEEGLELFRNGDRWSPEYEGQKNPFDPYIHQAVDIYGVQYDLISKDQRQLGKSTVLGCGFQMGAPTFLKNCLKDGIEVTEELAERAVKSYREKNAPVRQLWFNLERAAVAAVLNPGKKFKVNRTGWWVEDRYLYCELPSGRRLAYYGPKVRYEPTPWGEKRPKLYHWGVDPKTKKWVFGSTYGGKLTENVVQAIARDLMANALVKTEEAGYEMILSVHDEALGEREIGRGSLKDFDRLMKEAPAWAAGLPVKVEVWTGPRYKK